MVEFALSLPLVLVAFLVGVELLRLCWVKVALNDAASAVAQQVAELPSIELATLESDVYDKGKAFIPADGGGVTYHFEDFGNVSFSVLAGMPTPYEYKTSMGSVEALRNDVAVSVRVDADVRWITPLGAVLGALYGGETGGEGVAMSSTYSVICDASPASSWPGGEGGA